MMQRRSIAGVTLIELMVVMVIVAILAGVAYPTFRQYTIRANRTEAKTELLRLTQTLEKCYTRSHSYSGCLDGKPYTLPSGNYQITAKVDATGQAYDLKAEPKGGQTDDKKCGTLAVNELGARKERDSETLNPASKCW